MPEHESYDVAQICLNGHIVNVSSKKFPQFNKKFCRDCGAKTITECPDCNSSIKGKYGRSLLKVSIPKFCDNCGKSYPWVSSKIEAAHELADELDLPDKEKELLKKSIDEIVKETPKTEVGVIRFKKFMAKVGKESAESFKKILIDIIAETAKRTLYQS